MSEDEDEIKMYEDARNASGFDPWTENDDMDFKLPRIHGGNGDSDDAAHLLMVYNAPKDRKQINYIAGGSLLFFIVVVIIGVSLGPDVPPSHPLLADDVKSVFVLLSPPPELEDVCHPDAIKSESGRRDCQDLCKPAACCMETDRSTCFDDFRDICELYKPCGSLYIGRSDNYVPPPPANLGHLCSEASLATDYGFYECQSTCLMGECCLTSRWDSCFFSHIETCNKYASCQNLKERDHVSQVKRVEEACKASSIMTVGGKRKCEKLCKERGCCFATGVANCFADNQVWCGEFAACEDLNSQSNEDIGETSDMKTVTPPPKANLPKKEEDVSLDEDFDLDFQCRQENIRSQADLDKCESACLPSICCFTKDDCFTSSVVNCDDYSVCEPFVISALDDDITLHDDYINPTQALINKKNEKADERADRNSGPQTLEDVCSDENTETWEGRNACERECKDALCCIGVPYDCSKVKKSMCDRYIPACDETWRIEGYSKDDKVGLVNNKAGTVVTPPANLPSLCSAENIADAGGKRKCELKCNFGLCCVGIPSKCDDMSLCDAYNPCHSVWHVYETTTKSGEISDDEGPEPNESNFFDQLQMAPLDLENICSDESLKSFEGRLKCEVECDDALCCMGLNGDCSNEKQICTSYKPCRAVWGQTTSKTKSEDAKFNVPTDQDKITAICKENAISTPAGNAKCWDACEGAMCCIGIPQNCFNSKMSMCDAYTSCHNLWDKYSYSELAKSVESGDGISKPKSTSLNELKGSGNDDMPNKNMHPAGDQDFDDIIMAAKRGNNILPVDGLESGCTSVSISRKNLDACVGLCQSALCCFKTGPGSCMASQTNFCHAWNFCNLVMEESYEIDLVSMPERDNAQQLSTLQTKCSAENTATLDGAAECDDACEQWACCDRDDEETCYNSHKEECVYYELCPKEEERRVLKQGVVREKRNDSLIPRSLRY